MAGKIREWRNELDTLVEKTGISLEDVCEYIGVSYPDKIGFYNKIPRKREMFIGIGMAFGQDLHMIDNWIVRYGEKKKLYAKDALSDLIWIYLINSNHNGCVSSDPSEKDSKDIQCCSRMSDDGRPVIAADIGRTTVVDDASQPAITKGSGDNTSQPANTGGSGDNASQPAITGGSGDNASQSAITGDSGDNASRSAAAADSECEGGGPVSTTIKRPEINFFNLYDECQIKVQNAYIELWNEYVENDKETALVENDLGAVAHDAKYEGLRAFIAQNMDSFKTAYRKPRNMLSEYVRTILDTYTRANDGKETPINFLRGYLDDSMMNYITGNPQSINVMDMRSRDRVINIKAVPKLKRTHIALCLALGMTIQEINNYLDMMGYQPMDPASKDEKRLLEMLHDWDEDHPLTRRYKEKYLLWKDWTHVGDDPAEPDMSTDLPVDVSKIGRMKLQESANDSGSTEFQACSSNNGSTNSREQDTGSGSTISKEITSRNGSTNSWEPESENRKKKSQDHNLGNGSTGYSENDLTMKEELQAVSDMLMMRSDLEYEYSLEGKTFPYMKE